MGNSEGDQPWDFFGRNDAEAETPIVWPPHAKSWLIGKDSDAGRCRGPAPVDPGWFEGRGMESVSLEKYIFNYRYIERLEMDSVVGDSVEKEAE